MRYKKRLFFICLISLFLLAIGKSLHLLPDPLSKWISSFGDFLTFNKDTTILSSDFTELVEKYGGAVVNIHVYHDRASGQEPSRSETLPPFFRDPSSADFFRRFVPLSSENRDTYGSGFVISQDGYILTSAHVVSQAQHIKVTFIDKNEFSADLVGLDQYTDVALLKINAQHLPSVKIGEPSQMKVGQWVVAIGSPFEFDNTVTAGIISAIKRSLPNDHFVSFIQTDTAINIGSSGGPLFNVRGEVVGINAKIYSHSGAFSGIAFAVPIDIAMHAVEQIKKTGKVRYSKLGIHTQPMSASLARAFGLKNPKGALVAHLEKEGPAHYAGLQAGDIIFSVDGHSVESESDLPIILSKMNPYRTVVLHIWRRGVDRKINVQLGLLNTDSMNRSSLQKRIALPFLPTKRFEVLGVTASPLSQWQKKQFQLPQGGLLVEQVRHLAASAGLMRGDIIISLNQKSISSISELRIALEAAGSDVALLICRANTQFFIPLSFQEK